MIGFLAGCALWVIAGLAVTLLYLGPVMDIQRRKRRNSYTVFDDWRHETAAWLIPIMLLWPLSLLVWAVILLPLVAILKMIDRRDGKSRERA